MSVTSIQAHRTQEPPARRFLNNKQPVVRDIDAQLTLAIATRALNFREYLEIFRTLRLKPQSLET
jgi:hypothetical protein